MLSSWQLFLASAAYVLLLFGIAFYGDRRARRRGPPSRKTWIYGLSLGVYCTSWTFYGAVGRAASSGWDFLPIYLGPALLFVFGHSVIGRIIRISKRHNITSIADFIGARYGRHQKIAMLVTLIAVFGVLPYIALQIKAVAFSFEVLVGPAGDARASSNALMISVLLAIFAILFGTRHVLSTEKHHGMMLAIAFESVSKLLAFLAVGLFAAYGLFDGLGDAYRHALSLPHVAASAQSPEWKLGFLTQTLLAAAAALCLPRQFHVTVVENSSRAELASARWLFPVYLGLISLFVMPIMAAGVLLLPAATPADSYVLALPLASQNHWLAMAAYLGGFSAATSMVIVATVALSTMICNEIVMPLLLGAPRLGLDKRGDLSSVIKTIRRIIIAVLVMLAYLYYRRFTGPGSLASIGLLSFSAVLHFLPPLLAGLYWRRATFEGAIAGLLAGFLTWLYVLLLPSVLIGSAPETALVTQGPLGIAWLRPVSMFGIEDLDLITHGALVSLGVHLIVLAVVSLASTPGLRERLQVARFLEGDDAGSSDLPPVPLRYGATVGDLQALLERFFGPDRARRQLHEYAQRSGRVLPPEARIEPAQARYVENLLASAVGSSSARLILASTLRGRDMQLEDVVRLLDETSHQIQFNRELLRATLENLAQGVSVVDRDLRLVAWNQRYLELFDYPTDLIAVGRPIEEVVRHNAGRGLLSSSDGNDEAVQRRLDHMRNGHAYTHQRELPNGMVIEIRGNPMPGGGFVTSYSDVTDYKRVEQALRDANETLESRVAERTAELTALNSQFDAAKRAAEQANEAKTRFLASASHDLVQPLNAARLFTSAIDRSGLPASQQALVRQVEDALTAAEALLSGLLDISRLDGRAQRPRVEHVAVADVLGPLAAEFRALARERDLELRYCTSSAVVVTDPQLLRRILQNLLSNALRYTARGSVLLGCRREPGRLRIEVWDTGPGIAPEDRAIIFEEFRRLRAQDTRGERGMGLGLAIVDRVARMLDHPLGLRSWPGHGSVFSVSVPLGQRSRLRVSAPRPAPPPLGLHGRRVLCVDNEPAVLAALQALLESWGCEVIAALNENDARTAAEGRIPDLLIVDYHLDDGVNGVAMSARLRADWPHPVPGIVLTADHTAVAREDAQAQGMPLLPKPVKPAALRALVNRLLSQQRSA